jgi:hypothetical protein
VHRPYRLTTGGWIADDSSQSTIKNTLGVLVRIMEQAVRDGIIDRNPARVAGWQREYLRAEDELNDPRFVGAARLGHIGEARKHLGRALVRQVRRLG